MKFYEKKMMNSLGFEQRAPGFKKSKKYVVLKLSSKKIKTKNFPNF